MQRSNVARTIAIWHEQPTANDRLKCTWYLDFSLVWPNKLLSLFFFKKPRTEINNYLEDQSVDRNGTTAGSENGAEINSEPTTSTDANQQADLPMANR